MDLTIEPAARPLPGAAPVWSGHQPGLWHPGILAKLLLADVLSAAETGPAPVWLVVDHDNVEPLRFDVPTRRGDHLAAVSLKLGAEAPGVPPGCRRACPAPEPDDLANIWPVAAAVPMRRLEEALERLPPRPATPAEHATALALDLAAPLLSRRPEVVYSSRLFEHPRLGPRFRTLVHRLLHDATAAVAALNRAARAHRSAGVAPLSLHPLLVELPLWSLAEGRPRERVYADLADTDPWLVNAAGDRLNPASAWLAPRALLMTALVRGEGLACSHFLHGTGGARYDRITDDWWATWRPDEPLAAVGVATANLRLGLDAPLADRDELAAAKWRAHHLPHNLDREPDVAPGHPDLINEKRILLSGMDDDRDRSRRAAAFGRIHRINEALGDAHHVLLDRTRTAVATAEAGVRNRRTALRRDWPLFLYPAETLQNLRSAIVNRVRAGAAAGE